jgi:hypothetical protein
LSSSEFRCAFRVSLFFLIFFSLIYLHKLQGRERREKKTNKERKNLGHDDDITGIVAKISLAFGVLVWVTNGERSGSHK